MGTKGRLLGSPIRHLRPANDRTINVRTSPCRPFPEPKEMKTPEFLQKDRVFYNNRYSQLHVHYDLRLMQKQTPNRPVLLGTGYQTGAPDEEPVR
jgi:hypothetical protein